MKIGEEINEHTVINLYYRPQGKYKRLYVTVKCNKCNKLKDIRYSDLYKSTTMCSCYRIKYVHDIFHERLYRIYHHMKDRCYNVNNDAYKNYGAKGVKMCDEWFADFRNFRKWAISNGYSNDLTIDRIDANGNYEPNNCRWITKSENVARSNISNPRRKSHKQTQSTIERIL